MSDPEASAGWWARGLLFENCSCTLVCPGHVHFSQNCTHERCVGFWAIRFDEGEFQEVPLQGTRVVIAYDAPQHMIDGDWTEVLIIDEAATPQQRTAIETILKGESGGPWAKLAPFVSTFLPTRFAPIQIEEADGSKRVRIEGLLEGSVEPIRGRDRTRPVTFENMFNQIHPTSQVLATGSTRYDDGVIVIGNEGTHGLYSSFSWEVTAG